MWYSLPYLVLICYMVKITVYFLAHYLFHYENKHRDNRQNRQSSSVSHFGRTLFDSYCDLNFGYHLARYRNTFLAYQYHRVLWCIYTIWHHYLSIEKIQISIKKESYKMGDMSSYREKVANFGKQASQAEADKNYEQAFDYYMKALEIFAHMMKCKLPLPTQQNILTHLTALSVPPRLRHSILNDVQMRRTPSWLRYTSRSLMSTLTEPCI